MRVHIAAACLVLFASAGTPGTVLGQTNAETNAGIQFDFSLPGARSLALGGAFVALADDATATWANPAGLVILARPEVSIEGRSWDFLNSVSDRGHGLGSPSGIGFDNTPGLIDFKKSSRTVAPAFLSFVYPRGNWAVGIYRHQLSKFKAEIQSSGPFVDSGGDIDRVEPFIGAMQLDIANYGTSLSWRVSDRLLLGAGVSFYTFGIGSRTDRFVYSPLLPPPPSLRGAFTGVGQRFGPPDYSDANRILTVSEVGDDSALGANVGLLYRQPKWTVGAAYRYGPTFSYQATSVVGPGGLRDPFYVPFVGRVFDEEDAKFDLPDILALGFTVRPTDRLLISAEYDRVSYSQLTDNNVEVFGIEENNPVSGREIANLIRDGLQFPDANQFRVGTEYSLVRDAGTIAFRLGGWYDPDHRMRFESTQRVPRLEVLFRPGKDEFHITPGFGFSARRFQIDAGADISTRVNTISVSTVYRF